MPLTFDTEKELEDALYNNNFLLANAIRESCLPVEEKHYTVIRQCPIKGHGTADIVAASSDTIIIIELKNVPVGIDAFCQLCKYIAGVKDETANVPVYGLLIGPCVKDEERLGHCIRANDNISLCEFEFGLRSGLVFGRRFRSPFREDVKDCGVNKARLSARQHLIERFGYGEGLSATRIPTQEDLMR